MKFYKMITRQNKKERHVLNYVYIPTDFYLWTKTDLYKPYNTIMPKR